MITCHIRNPFESVRNQINELYPIKFQGDVNNIIPFWF